MVAVETRPAMSGVPMNCTVWFCLNGNTLLLGLAFCMDCKSH